MGNSPIEKVRRYFSMPGLMEPNLSSFSNISKISAVKDPDECKEESFIKCKEIISKENSGDNSIHHSLSNNSELVTPSDSSGCVEFVRNEPQTRLSKNIKQMFQNVVQHQVNALSNLERFYEAQLDKLERERRRSIAQAPNDNQIKEFYEKQLHLLEERVHSSLTFISQNKCTKFANMSRVSQSGLELELQSAQNSEPLNIEQKKQFKMERLSKVMIVNQTQLNNQFHSNNANNPTKAFKSRTLLGLKNSFISKNNLLPSKSNIIQNRSGKKKEFFYNGISY